MQKSTKSKQEYRTSKKNKYEVPIRGLLFGYGVHQFPNFKSL